MSTTIDETVEATEEVEQLPRRSRKKKLLVLLLLAGLGAAAWFLVLAPDGPEKEVPGEVLTMEPIQVNLAAGHYLRVGIAMQLTEQAHEVDGSKALDAVIGIFSGLQMSEVTRPDQREELKGHLEELLDERYHGDVMGVYFTEFVTQ